MASIETQIRRLQRRARQHLKRYRIFHERRGNPRFDDAKTWDVIKHEATQFNKTMERIEKLDKTCPDNIRLDPGATGIWEKPVKLN